MDSIGGIIICGWIETLGWIETWAAVVLLFWCGLAGDRRRWWPARWRLPAGATSGANGDSAKADSAKASGPEDVAVVIPARNEAETLPRTLPVWIAQRHRVQCVVVVDDSSTDGTADLVAPLASTGDITLVRAPPRPEGWTGKLHALSYGLSKIGGARPGGQGESERGSPEWVLFTDADIVHPNNSVDRLLAQAKRGNYDLVSVMVRLSTGSFWERLLMPPFVYFFQLMYPFRKVSDPRSKVAAAAGGCVLLRRSLLARIGGLERIKGAVIDDVQLAREVKAAGGRCWLGLDPDMTSVRGYARLGDIVEMVARTAFTELNYRYSLVAATWLVMLGLFAAPPVLAALAAARASTPGFALATGAWLLQALTLLPAVRYLRAGAGYAATLPAAAVIYAAMTTVSAWRHWRGQGLRWRGRTTRNA